MFITGHASECDLFDVRIYVNVWFFFNWLNDCEMINCRLAVRSTHQVWCYKKKQSERYLSGSRKINQNHSVVSNIRFPYIYHIQQTQILHLDCSDGCKRRNNNTYSKQTIYHHNFLRENFFKWQTKLDISFRN